jgi:hypothetical protein
MKGFPEALAVLSFQSPMPDTIFSVILKIEERRL